MPSKTLPPKDLQAVLKQFREIAVTGNEIDEAAEEPVDWVWEPYVASGSICLIGGNTTGGKTTFAFLLLAARCSPRPIDFLEHTLTPAPPSRYIVIIEPEHSRGSAARKLLRSARLLDLDPELVSRRILLVAGGSSLNVGDARWRQLCELIAGGLVSDVLLDTIASTTIEEANDEQEQAKLFTKLRLAIDSAPSSAPPPMIWALAHKRKGKSDDEELDATAISGSLQRAAQSNTILMIRSNRRDHRIVSATVFFAKTKEDPIGGFSDTDLIPKTYIVSHNRFQLQNPKKADKPLIDRITDLLASAPDGLSANAISTALKRSFKDVKTALDQLLKTKKVRYPDEGPRRDPDVPPDGCLFFIVSPKKSGTKQTTPTKNNKSVKKTPPDDPPDDPRRFADNGNNVVDIRGFRKDPDEK
jgi:hypothetical protein